jgi:hypothetical protein
MSVSIITNKGVNTSESFSYRLASCERVILVADTNGDVARLSFASLFKNGFNMGPTFQAGKLGTINVKFTSEAEEDALNPANDANIAWHDWKTLNGSEMATPSPLIFTVAKITFTVRNRLFITSL